jgi:hypothetical protein
MNQPLTERYNPANGVRTTAGKNFLVLPTGQVLQTDFSSTVEIYTPSGSANSSWARRS